MEFARLKLRNALEKELRTSRFQIQQLSKERLDLIQTDVKLKSWHLHVIDSHLRREFEHRRALLAQLRVLAGVPI